MTAFRLRPAALDDETAVTRLLEASYGQLMPSAYGETLTAELLPIISKANPQLLASGAYYVAESPDGAVIGAGGWTKERPGTGEIEAGTGHIRHVAIHPDRTGQGVGRALIEHCLSEARSAGMIRFECYASLNAVDFYGHLGFLKVRPIDVPMGGGRVMPSLVMERFL